MIFDRFAMLDWSGGNQTSVQPCKDAIWLGVHGRDPQYLRNRQQAEQALADLIQDCLDQGERLFLGVDFCFGFPAGFGRALTGRADPFAVWDWFENAIQDTPQSNNRFEVAAGINRQLGQGKGPFWGNASAQDLDGLPRAKERRENPFPERRKCEEQAKGSFPIWQLAYAGAVGSQVLVGLPVLNRLRKRFAGQVAVWPFDACDTAPIVFVETWPGLIEPLVKGREGIRDQIQVDLMAQAFQGLTPHDLNQMTDVDTGEEGWIFGLGHEDKLQAAAAALSPPPLQNDCFSLPPGVSWTPGDDALTMLRDRLHPVVGQQDVPLMQAGGRVLARDVYALRSNPPQANSAVDGYGFARASIQEGDNTLPLMQGRAAAGVPYAGKVPPGAAIRILTGAAVPEGVDAVVLEEDCAVNASHVAFRGPVKPFANIRKAGEDLAQDDLALPKGRHLTPADLALCSAIGHGMLPVFDQLRVGVLSTGDEILPPGAPAGPGQIYDANRPMLLNLLQRLGHHPVDLGHVQDDRDVLRAALDKAQADVILTSGGASAGDEDHVSALLAESGALSEWRIALKPGRPLALGMWQGKPVFGLPGNPVAALVCTVIFAGPALSLMSGAGWTIPQGFTVPAAFTKNKKPGRREYLRARIRNGHAEVFKSEGSGRISGLSWAEGLVELPDQACQITPGTPVTYIPFSSFGF
jgi:molybdopterin molybdotransferase